MKPPAFQRPHLCSQALACKDQNTFSTTLTPLATFQSSIEVVLSVAGSLALAFVLQTSRLGFIFGIGFFGYELQSFVGSCFRIVFSQSFWS
jgi:hypothetical protein